VLQSETKPKLRQKILESSQTKLENPDNCKQMKESFNNKTLEVNIDAENKGCRNTNLIEQFNSLGDFMSNIRGEISP
jgi:hypothetical protein